MVDFAVSQLGGGFQDLGFYRAWKFTEFLLKLFNVHVEQYAMGVRHMMFLWGFEEKILNFFYCAKFKKKKNQTLFWSESVPNIVFFSSIWWKLETEAYKENTDKSPSQGSNGKHCSKACKQTILLKWVSEFQWILIICEDR